MKFLVLLMGLVANAGDYGKTDRTLADDRNAKIESISLEGTSGSSQITAGFWTNSWKLSADWKDRVDNTEIAYIKDLTLKLHVSIPNPALAGDRLVDLRVSTRLGEFADKEEPLLPLYTSEPMGIRVERMGSQQEGRFLHKLYRLAIPYTANQKELDIKLKFPMVQIEQTISKGIIREEVGSGVTVHFRRNQALPTDLVGGGPARGENLLATLRVR